MEDTNDLVSRHCENLRFGTSVVTDDEAGEFLLTVPSWRREFHDGVNKLKREFHLWSLKTRLAFPTRLPLYLIAKTTTPQF